MSCFLLYFLPLSLLPAQPQRTNADRTLARAYRHGQQLVEFGKEILQIVPGRVSTEVDASLSFDKEATKKKVPSSSSSVD